MPRINLLPWRAEERKLRQRNFLFALVGATAAAAIVVLLVNLFYGQVINNQNKKNTLLQGEIEKLDQQITEILELDAQKQRMRARMDIVEKLQRSRPEVVHLFDQLARTVPDGLYLSSIKQNDRRLEIKGVAQSSTRVSAFMRNIDASEWLDNPELEVVETQKGSSLGSDFTLYASQVGVVLPGQEGQQ